MKKIAVALLTIVLLCVPISVLANGFGVSPPNAELEVPKDGSAALDFIVYGFDGTIDIGLEDIPLTYGPTSVDVTDGETITVTFYGDGTNNTYEGKVTFLAGIGEQVSAGIKVKLTVHVNMTTIVEPTPTPGGGGGGGWIPPTTTPTTTPPTTTPPTITPPTTTPPTTTPPTTTPPTTTVPPTTTPPTITPPTTPTTTPPTTTAPTTTPTTTPAVEEVPDKTSPWYGLILIIPVIAIIVLVVVIKRRRK